MLPIAKNSEFLRDPLINAIEREATIVTKNKKIIALICVSIFIVVSIVFTNDNIFAGRRNDASFLQALEAGNFTIMETNTPDVIITSDDIVDIFHNTPPHHEESFSKIIAIYDAYSHKRNFSLWIGIIDDEMAAYAKFLPFVEGYVPDFSNPSSLEFQFRFVNLEYTESISEHGIKIIQIEHSSGVAIAMGG